MPIGGCFVLRNTFKRWGTPEAKKMAVAAIAMKGRALRWWFRWYPRHPWVTWDTFTIAFLWRFKPEYWDVLPLIEEIDEEDSDLIETPFPRLPLPPLASDEEQDPLTHSYWFSHPKPRSEKERKNSEPEQIDGSETDLTAVLNAWYSAGFYTGKYLVEQSIGNRRQK